MSRDARYERISNTIVVGVDHNRICNMISPKQENAKQSEEFTFENRSPFAGWVEYGYHLI